ncbi:hypothetical protein PVAP13_8KG230801 [Panicum virgatum]|uniref:Uncharacterized protein n=1 Tax=Panicum virgatum TaxID=38727 RepID=A0A8T0PHA1_PANVG|nr:hypothetical protein PVAP13_8KG230801 [Panicum virgatum]
MTRSTTLSLGVTIQVRRSMTTLVMTTQLEGSSYAQVWRWSFLKMLPLPRCFSACIRV